MHTLNPFVCGTFHDDYYDEPCLASPSSSPRKYKRKYSRNNNPYSARGLDKFSALLADLDVKRQYIYSQMNPHEISFVRFVYNHTDDIVPLVVKVKNSKNQKRKSQELKVVRARTFNHTSEEISLEESSPADDQNSSEERKKTKIDTIHHHTKVAKSINISWKMKNPWDVGMPSFYLPLVIIMILLLLLVFGRSVTILFTCIMWYMISMFRTIPPKNLRKSMKNKEERLRGSSGSGGKKIVSNEGAKKKAYVRGMSEKKMEVGEGSKKKEFLRRLSERKMEVGEGSKIKKELVRWWSEKKMVVSEGGKKFLDCVRGESEKKMVAGAGSKKFLDCIRGESGADRLRNSPRSSPRSGADSPRSGADSPRSGADSEDSKNKKKKGSKDKNSPKKD